MAETPDTPAGTLPHAAGDPDDDGLDYPDHVTHLLEAVNVANRRTDALWYVDEAPVPDEQREAGTLRRVELLLLTPEAAAARGLAGDPSEPTTAARRAAGDNDDAAARPVSLTPADTWPMIAAGALGRTNWVYREDDEQLTRGAAGEITGWTLTVHLDDEGRTATLNHTAMVDAMRAMVAEPDRCGGNHAVVPTIAAVLDAADNAQAVAALRRLGELAVDWVAQVAAMGTVECP